MARRSLEKFQQMKQQMEVGPDGEAHPPKKKIPQQTWFLIAGAALLAIAGVIFIIRMQETHEIAVQKEEQASKLGEVGRQSDYKLDRKEGMNLPAAKAAVDAKINPDLVVEVPYEWNGNKDLARDELKKRFAAIVAKYPLDEMTMTQKEPCVLRVDRDLPYHYFGLAAVEAKRAGFDELKVACLIDARKDDVGYLSITMPNTVEKHLPFRMYFDGDQYTYLIGPGDLRYNDLRDARDILAQFYTEIPDTLVVVAPTRDISVQHFIEGVNTVAGVGFKRIGIGNTGGLE